jgi:hypothetical protein
MRSSSGGAQHEDRRLELLGAALQPAGGRGRVDHAGLGAQAGGDRTRGRFRLGAPLAVEGVDEDARARGEALVVVDGGDHDGCAGGGRERAAEDDGLVVLTGGVDSVTTGTADLPSVTVDPGERREPPGRTMRR